MKTNKMLNALANMLIVIINAEKCLMQEDIFGKVIEDTYCGLIKSMYILLYETGG